MEQQLAPALQEHVRLYDHQLQAWLRSTVNQLIDLYETQAEVFREQVRRLSGSGDGKGSTEQQQALRADLEELRHNGLVELAESESKTNSTEKDGRR